MKYVFVSNEVICVCINILRTLPQTINLFREILEKEGEGDLENTPLL